MGGYEDAINQRRRLKRIAHHARRDAAIDAYGGKCVVCGQQDRTMLQIRNRHHRYWAKAMTGKSIRSGADKFRVLAQLGFPQDQGFELVCATCVKPKVDAARSPGATTPTTGGCPHDTTRV